MMWSFFVSFAWLVLGYLAGSFPTAYLIALRLRGIDIRTYGSGNVGATNLGRLMGKKWAFLVAIVDMLKGGVAVLMIRLFGASDVTVAMAAFAAVMGHNYPIWLDFKGGKGVSTTYGTLFFVAPPGSMIAVPLGGLVWLIILKIGGYVSLASILSLFGLAFILPLCGVPAPFALSAFGLAVLSTWRHRANVKRLLSGRESRARSK
ncbi:protein of unknown function DUF205 [Dethiosulfovibrio peptidovorans DSM 11002]|uniref:Glycerol-3-phosphate acyltransferase n=2 Tax=Dethiosulfovibrio TaxID=47054 RepID=D2Z8U5_9BACT|nr:protein of unknown function DUF205 [Dethiosulfovibrio peptidovorans DSM 11002]